MKVKQVSFSVSCRWIKSFLPSSSSFARVLPRVGDDVTDLIARESHRRFCHLRPLLDIFLLTGELLRPVKAFDIDETRSVFPNLSRRNIVAGTYCFCQSSDIPPKPTQARNDNLGKQLQTQHQKEKNSVLGALPRTKVLWQLWWSRPHPPLFHECTKRPREPARFQVNTAGSPRLLPKRSHNNSRAKIEQTKLTNVTSLIFWKHDLSWIAVLSHSSGVRASDGGYEHVVHLIRTVGLRATASACTSCNVVFLSTTSVNVSKHRQENNMILSYLTCSFELGSTHVPLLLCCFLYTFEHGRPDSWPNRFWSR